jgi:hypothetical protein
MKMDYHYALSLIGDSKDDVLNFYKQVASGSVLNLTDGFGNIPFVHDLYGNGYFFSTAVRIPTDVFKILSRNYSKMTFVVLVYHKSTLEFFTVIKGKISSRGSFICEKDKSENGFNINDVTQGNLFFEKQLSNLKSAINEASNPKWYKTTGPQISMKPKDRIKIIFG